MADKQTKIEVKQEPIKKATKPAIKEIKVTDGLSIAEVATKNSMTVGQLLKINEMSLAEWKVGKVVSLA